MRLKRKNHEINSSPAEELRTNRRSRRHFLATSAIGAAGAVGGAVALNAVVASPAAAAPGDIVPITPIRIYDSRPNKAQFGSGQFKGDIFTYTGTPTSRYIVFGDVDAGGPNLIPATALGAFINLTVTNTVATGALAVTALDDLTAPSASLINWFGNGQILANASFVPTASGGFDISRAGIQVWIVAGTPNLSRTHFIIDCVGYVAGPLAAPTTM